MSVKTIPVISSSVPDFAEASSQSHISKWFAGVLYAAIFVAACGYTLYFLGTPARAYKTDLYREIISTSLYFFIGILYTTFLYSTLLFLSKQKLFVKLFYSLAVGTCVFVVLTLISLTRKIGHITDCLDNAVIFFIPYVLGQLWLMIKREKVTGNIWYPPTEADAYLATIYLNSKSIFIKVAPEPATTPQKFLHIAPGRISIGKMFFNFVVEELRDNSVEIKMAEENGNIFGWHFFTPTFFGLAKRKLKFEESLDDNKLKNGSVVIAKRIV